MDIKWRKLNDIHLRDPFIIKDGEGGYIMTGSSTKITIYDSDGVYYYHSTDLENWRGPYLIISKKHLRKSKDFWSPEIYHIDNIYYMIITLTCKGHKRGSYLLASKKIVSGYKMIGRITPEDKMSLHATLLEEDGEYWVTYCHEWKECVNGEIRRVKLTPDMKGIVAETDTLLFKATANGYKTSTSRLVTDAPYYLRQNKELYIIWSTYDNRRNYLTLMAKSSNGKISGEWEQLAPLIVDDGGHAMVFNDYSGIRHIVYHTPSTKNFITSNVEHPSIKEFSCEYGMFGVNNLNMSIYKNLLLYASFEQKLAMSFAKYSKLHGLDQLSLSHTEIIVSVNNFKKISMLKISELVGKTPQTVTTLVSKLEQLGYVEILKDALDRRKSYVVITDLGGEIAVTIEKIYKDIATALYSKVPTSFTDAHIATVKLMTASLDADLSKGVVSI